MNDKKRPLSVAIIGWLYIAVGVGGFATHLSDFRAKDPFPYDVVLIELVRILAIVSGVFMLRGANWARWVAVAWIGFHVIVSAFHSLPELLMHCLFFVLITWLLLRRDAADYFTAPAKS